MGEFAYSPLRARAADLVTRTGGARTGARSARATHTPLSLPQMIGNQGMQRFLGTVQAKLTVGPPGDVYEQEADRVSEQVMRMAEPPREHACACGGVCPECQMNRPDEEHGYVQTQGITSSDLGQTAVPPVVHEVLRSPGQPLDPATRAFVEPRFGQDFSRVRVHTDQLAARSAEALVAQAYTVGSNVVFGMGRYAAATPDGQRLLAHELAHVLQQSVGDPWPAVSADARIHLPGGAMAAERAGRSVGGRVATGPVLARQPLPTMRPTAPAKTVFHPGVMHDHKPSGRWVDVQADPNSGFLENRACAHFDPIHVMQLAAFAGLTGKWIAIAHLKWFFQGGGADFVENSNLDLMLRTDSGVQAVLSAKIPTGRSSGTVADDVKINQNDYDDEEFRYAFGAIDRLDFEVDFATGTLHAWFQDRYEWHPVYPFYTKFPDDIVRETNCVHAAAVELKSGTARDYWMKGEATIPVKALQSAAWRYKESQFWPAGHPELGSKGVL